MVPKSSAQSKTSTPVYQSWVERLPKTAQTDIASSPERKHVTYSCSSLPKLQLKNLMVTPCNEMFSTETFQLDSERVYTLPFKIMLDTKLREIQYKILYRICYANAMLFKFGLADSPLCYFCNEELVNYAFFSFNCCTKNL